MKPERKTSKVLEADAGGGAGGAGVENIYHDNNQTDKASHGEIASPFPCCPVNREYL